MSVFFASIPLLCCGGLTPATSQAPTLLLAHSPPRIRTGEKIGRTKARKLVDRDKDTVMYEGKKTHTKQSKGSQPPPSTGRPTPRQSPINCQPGSQKIPPSSSSNPVLLLTMTSHGIDFGQSGSAVPAVSPPSLWHAPAYSRGCRVGNKEGLDPVLFSNNQNIGALITLFWSKTRIYDSTNCLGEGSVI